MDFLSDHCCATEFLFLVYFTIYSYISFLLKSHIEITRTLILFFLSILSIKELHTITKE